MSAQPSALAKGPRERVNWLIHMHYVHEDYVACLKLIEEQLKLYNGLCEYPIYIKGEPRAALRRATRTYASTPPSPC